MATMNLAIPLGRINKAGDPLVQLNDTVDWEIFRSTLEEARKKPKKSKAGAKGFDVVLLFKILILQSLYNLSDEALAFQRRFDESWKSRSTLFYL